jgi:nicotinate phosphoribosyltransferase
MIDPLDPTRQREMSAELAFEDLLKQFVDGGQVIAKPESLEQIRHRVSRQLDQFHNGVKRLANPHRYPVGLEENLHQLKSRLVLRARGLESEIEQ